MASTLDKIRQAHADNVLDTNDLDHIAGGSGKQMADDSRFLNVLLRGNPAQCDRWGEYKLVFRSSPDQLYQIARAWDACGIQVDLSRNPKTDNKYIDMKTGQSVSQSQARQIAMNNIGRHLNHSDWY